MSKAQHSNSRLFLPILALLISFSSPALAENSCRRLFSDSPWTRVTVPARTMVSMSDVAEKKSLIASVVRYFRGEGHVHLERDPVSIQGVDAYRVLAEETADNDLSKAEAVMERHSGHAYIQEFPESRKSDRAYAFAFRDGEKPIEPVAVFRRGVERAPSEWDGTIWHEVAHSVNLSHALKGHEIGRSRTFFFQVPEKASYRFNVRGYKRAFRIDEIHVRAVQSGIDLRDALRDLKEGDVEAARKHLQFAKSHMDASLEFTHEADAQLARIRELMAQAPNDLEFSVIHTDIGQAVRVVYQFPYYSEEGMSVARRLTRRLLSWQKPNTESPLMMQFLLPPNAKCDSLSIADLQQMTAAFVDNAHRDYHRFDKIFDFLRARRQAIEKAGGLAPAF